MSGVITVGHVNHNVRDVINIKIDRSSVLGNPFYMANESMRDDVCDKYEECFNDNVKIEGAFRDEVIRIYRLVKEGNSVNLQCWCAPKRCHGLTIKAFIESHL